MSSTGNSRKSSSKKPPPPQRRQQQQPPPPPPAEDEEDSSSSEEQMVVVEGNLNLNIAQGTLHQQMQHHPADNDESTAATGTTGGGGGGGGDANITSLIQQQTPKEEEDEDQHTTTTTTTAVLMDDDDQQQQNSSSSQEAPVLPSTVTVLEGPGGSKVYLVGTAHFSTQSQNDVRNTISLVRPSVVVLELCHARRNILTLDEDTILREAKDFSIGKLRSSGIQGLLHLVLLSMSAQLTRKLGMAPGGEFRAALNEARALNNNCLVVLGDRPFNVTISRALASLTFTQKIKLAWQFIASSDDITKEEIERCKERDLLEKMLSEMTGEFPSITEVFVNERDVFLAHSLLLACQQQQQDDDSTNNQHPTVIVGVVGMGHVKGISTLFGTTTDNHVARVNTLPERSRSVVGLIVKYAVWTAIAYGTYKLVLQKHTPALISAAKQLKLQIAAAAATAGAAGGALNTK